ncbi:DUF4157 domain-containing protein [Photobacterium halotolerans]|uniref:DUF4157 domain-containing protein n=1 Tax=Photobacterium halotolerans TaxID=265726 RepID=UPI000427AA2B|nr:DUF4157 domain-containing protein [Photobacterium halotolerans]NAX49217.1 DUF4157 domain-containing protein [Photobacterium halotolerans]
MYQKVIVLIAVIFAVSGCKDRDETYANPPQELLQHVERLLPAAEHYVRGNEAEALEKGVPLDANQLRIASRVGLKSPDKVRVYYVDKLPFPDDPELAALATKYGYSSPLTGAYTYGYGLWIKRSEKDNQELLAHELIHVRQAEQLGVREQTKQYLLQLFIYGYRNAPMELEAYREASQYL